MVLTNRITYPNVAITELLPGTLKAAAKAATMPPGQYAIAWEERGMVLMARDPLGCNKLFYGQDSQGQLVVGSRITSLLRSGVAIESVLSVPPGHLISVGQGETLIRGGSTICDMEAGQNFDLALFQQTARTELEQFFSWLARRFSGSRFVVCLSGGLDSSIVASFASRHFATTAAVFSYLDGVDAVSLLKGADPAMLPSVSDDYRHAVEVARLLGLPILPVLRPAASVATAIRHALLLGQDWRDFNVHCATVNLFLAESIRAAFPDEHVVVITGDLMNEYVCDYRAEEFGGKTYYVQPRVSVGKRRRFFLRGLDAGDREIGVFSAYGHTVVEPYAPMAALYMQIPAQLLEDDDAKLHLNGPLVHQDLLAAIGQRKCRAQVGGSDGGTLGIYHRLGVDQDRLFSLWASELGLNSQNPSVAGIIQFGRYREALDIRS